MNLPIELRVWNGHKMVHGPTDDNPSSGWVLACAATIRAEVQCFTGICDRHARKIFMGDVIEGYIGGFSDREIRAEVTFMNGCFGIKTHYEPLYALSNLQNVRIIGNTHTVRV